MRFAADFIVGCVAALVALAVLAALGLGDSGTQVFAALLVLLVIFAVSLLWRRRQTWFTMHRRSRPSAAFAVLGLLALGACSTAGSLSPSQTLEQGDTAASLAYAATATALNTYEAANPAGVAKGEALKAKAWALLQQERSLYAQGQSVDALVTQLQNLAIEAKGLTP